MADDYNSPFGSSPFGGFNQPRPQEQPAFNPTPVQQPAASQPAPVQQSPVESNANNEDKPANDTKKNKGSRPKKNARPSNQITREVVDRILTINDLLNSIDERTLGLLKAVSEIHPMASRSNVIAGLVSSGAKTVAEKNIANERDIIDNIDDPFAIALAFAALSRDERKEHWNRVLSCEQEAAAEVAQNDNGVFPQTWKDVRKESMNLNKLYSKVRDDYSARLNDVAEVLSNIK